MARDYVNEIRSEAMGACANGWQPCPGKPSTLRRITTHSTPEHIPASWWPRPEYQAVEFLDFLVFDRNRAPKVIHRAARCPWVERSDRSISYRKAVELMQQPLDQSPVHSNH